MAKKITVIGYGNPLRGDDGVAHVVLDKLEEMLASDQSIASGGVELMRRHQLDVVDAELMSESSAIIFVDAHVSEKLGDVEITEIAGMRAKSVNVTHISSPEEIATLAREIYGVEPSVFVCAVRGFDFSFGASVTEPALRLAQSAAEELYRLIITL